MIITLNNCVEDAYSVLSLGYKYGSSKFFVVREDCIILLSNNEVITIEAGFETDLSSVPRFLWGLYPPYGDFVFAAVIHDWLYIHNKERTMSRRDADREMWIWSDALNPKGAKDNHRRYLAVRLFGGSWWNHKHNWK